MFYSLQSCTLHFILLPQHRLTKQFTPITITFFKITARAKSNTAKIAQTKRQSIKALWKSHWKRKIFDNPPTLPTRCLISLPWLQDPLDRCLALFPPLIPLWALCLSHESQASPPPPPESDHCCRSLLPLEQGKMGARQPATQPPVCSSSSYRLPNFHQLICYIWPL